MARKEHAAGHSERAGANFQSLQCGTPYHISYSEGLLQIHDRPDYTHIPPVASFLIEESDRGQRGLQRLFDAFGDEHQPLLFVGKGFWRNDLQWLKNLIFAISRSGCFEPITARSMLLIPKSCFESLPDAEKELIFEGQLEALVSSWNRYSETAHEKFQQGIAYRIAKWQTREVTPKRPEIRDTRSLDDLRLPDLQKSPESLERVQYKGSSIVQIRSDYVDAVQSMFDLSVGLQGEKLVNFFKNVGPILASSGLVVELEEDQQGVFRRPELVGGLPVLQSLHGDTNSELKELPKLKLHAIENLGTQIVNASSQLSILDSEDLRSSSLDAGGGEENYPAELRNEGLLSVKEVAASLSISPRWVQKVCANRNLGRKIGRDLFLSPTELQFIRENRGNVGRPPRIKE
jgi:hypothetical protein